MFHTYFVCQILFFSSLLGFNCSPSVHKPCALSCDTAAAISVHLLNFPSKPAIFCILVVYYCFYLPLLLSGFNCSPFSLNPVYRDVLLQARSSYTCSLLLNPLSHVLFIIVSNYYYFFFLLYLFIIVESVL